LKSYFVTLKRQYGIKLAVPVGYAAFLVDDSRLEAKESARFSDTEMENVRD